MIKSAFDVIIPMLKKSLSAIETNKKYALFLFALIFLAVFFYSTYPKYKFHYGNNILRENKVTGRIDFFDERTRKWFDITCSEQKNLSVRDRWKQVENHEVYKNASPEKKKLIEDKFFDKFVKESL